MSHNFITSLVPCWSNDTCGDIVTIQSTPIELISINSNISQLWISQNDVITTINNIGFTAGNNISLNKDSIGSINIDVKIPENGALFSTSNGLIIDFYALSQKQINDDDWVIFEQNGLSGSTDSTDSSELTNILRKTHASDILPYTVFGNHVFLPKSQIDYSYIAIEHNSFFINSNNLLVKNPYLTLNFNYDLVNTFQSRMNVISGIKIPTLEKIVKLEYIGTINSWISNTNIGVDGGKYFNVNSPNFFLGLLNSQSNPSLKLQLYPESNDKFFKVQVYSSSKLVTFSFNDTSFTTTDESTDTISSPSNQILFQSNIETDGSALFQTTGKIYIGNLTGSVQFKSQPQMLVSGQYKPTLIPYSNEYGLLNYNWVNRYVTSNYDLDITVGDMVRIIENTNGTPRLTKSYSNNEETSNFIGICENISYSGQCYVVLSGEFNLNLSSNNVVIENGITYYLANETTDGSTLTSTKPNNIIKAVVIGTGINSGILFNSGSVQNPVFNNISVTNSLINEHFVFTPETTNDTLSFRGGAGITLTHTTDDAILISASGGAGTQNTFSRVNSVPATGINSNIQLTGMNGLGVEVNGTPGAEIEVELSIPNSFGVVQIVGNSTDDEEFTINSVDSNDTLEIFAGTGISITANTNNGFVITATGTSVPAVDSVTNSILAQMPAYAIKASDSSGNPVDVQIPSGPSAGYVLGRITDDYNVTSGITSLSSTNLRKLLNISLTGYIQPLQDSFKYINITDENHSTNNTSLEANISEDVLNFIAGPGIIITGNENTSIEKEIRFSLDLETYIAPLVKGFNKIKLDSGSYYNSSASNSVLEFNETSTIHPAFGTTDNATVSFTVKTNSITNNELAPMDPYTVKVNNDNTDDNVTDLFIPSNTVLGRYNGGVLAGLTGTNLKNIIGLSATSYFKQINITNSNITQPIISTIGNETINLIAGENVVLTKQIADNQTNIIISSSGGSNATKPIYSTSGSSIGDQRASKLSFVSSSILGSSQNLTLDTQSLYSNITLTASYNNTTDTYTQNINLSNMPQCSVKVASSSLVSGFTDYIPTNLSLPAGTVLGRAISSSVLSALGQTQLRSIVAINSISKLEIRNYNASGLQTSQYINVYPYSAPNQTFKFSAYGGLLIEQNTATGVISFTNTQSTLFNDLTPKLGGNLDLNSKLLTLGSTKVLQFSNNIIPHNSNLEFAFKFQVDSNPILSLVNQTDTVTTQTANLILNSYNTGSYIVIGKNNLSNYSGAFNIKSQNGIFYFTDASDNDISLNSSKSLNIVAGTPQTNNKIISLISNNIPLNIIGKGPIQNGPDYSYRLEVFTEQGFDLIFGAGWDGSVYSPVKGSSKIIFKSDIVLDYDVQLQSSISGGFVPIHNGIQINDRNSSSINSNIITSGKYNVSSYTNEIDSIIADSSGVGSGSSSSSGNSSSSGSGFGNITKNVSLYNMYITDTSNPFISAYITFKVITFNSNTNNSIVVEQMQTYSSNVTTNDPIKNLTFSTTTTSSGYKLLLNTIGAGKTYNVKFTRSSF